jgi:hypothetical protein
MAHHTEPYIYLHLVEARRLELCRSVPRQSGSLVVNNDGEHRDMLWMRQ